MTEKTLLRQEKINARDSLTAEERLERSNEICRRILEDAAYRNAKTVMIYKAVRGEARLDLLETVNAASPEPKRFVYPLCLTHGRMLAVEPGSPDTDGPAWKKGSFGIPAPDPDRGRVIPPEEIDYVICPCTAFDDENRRLGMGGGYYDRFLPLCKNAVITAAAFEIQRAASVPSDDLDQPVNKVFTCLMCQEPPAKTAQ